MFSAAMAGTARDVPVVLCPLTKFHNLCSGFVYTANFPQIRLQILLCKFAFLSVTWSRRLIPQRPLSGLPHQSRLPFPSDGSFLT